MEVRYSKKFLKQLAAVPSQTRVKIEGFVFNELVSVSSISGLGKLKKCKVMMDFIKSDLVIIDWV